MLKRKVTHSIKKWIGSKNKKCLVIQGVRQTGKTYIVEEGIITLPLYMVAFFYI